MLKLIQFILLLSVPFITYAQLLTPVQCYNGGRSETVNKFKLTSDGNILTTIRSTSYEGEFEGIVTDDSLGYYSGRTWLYKMNNKGEKIWKQVLPNSERTMSLDYIYFGWGGYFPAPIFDFPYAVFTPLQEEELALHYVYFDSFPSPYQNSRLRNAVLQFGLINSADGNFITQPFVLDTLLGTLNDTSLIINYFRIMKVNDSIYQLALKLEKRVPFGSFFIRIVPDARFYTININSNEVKKKRHYIYHYFIMNNDERFYLCYNVGPFLFIQKLNEEYEIEQTSSIPVGTNTSEVHQSIAVLNNGNFLVSGREQTGLPGDSKFSAVLFTVDKQDLSYSRQYINSFADALATNNFIEPIFSIGNSYESNYDISEFSLNNAQLNYAIQSATGYYTDTTINKKFLLKFDRNSGWINWSKEIEEPLNLTAIEIDSSVYLFKSILSSSSVGLGQVIFNNQIEKILPNQEIAWNTALPDTILADGKTYVSINNLKFINRLINSNKMIVGIFTANNDSTEEQRMFFYEIGLLDGFIKPIILPDGFNYLSYNQGFPTVFNLSIISEINFFDDVAGNLYLIVSFNDICEISSALDVVVYRVDEFISSTLKSLIASSSTFTIYPNPASDRIHLQISKEFDLTNARYAIYDITGRLYLTDRLLQHNQFDIDISNLNNGLYLIVATNEKETLVQKFQKMK